MGECIHLLANAEPCGIQSNDVLCGFHRHKPLTSDTWGQIQHYCLHNRRPTLDLSGMTFEGIDFVPEIGLVDKPVLFDRSEFRNCAFKDMRFKGSLSFNDCSFVSCRFEGVHFKGKDVDFRLATFSDTDVIFRHCIFDASNKITFAGALLGSKSVPFLFTFLRASQVDFNDCSTDAGRFYILVSNSGKPIIDYRYLAIDAPKMLFTGMKLTGNFEYVNHLDCRDFAPTVLFSMVNFSQMRTATFIEANLKRARFTYSKLDNVHFIAPQWPDRDGRWIIHDELERVELTTDEHIKDTYTQLKRNYEDGRKYAEAGQWFYREMECRRRLIDAKADGSALVRWMTRNLFRSYKAVSDYGENIVKPFLWLIGLFLLWGPLYFYCGFGSGSETVSYDIAWPPTAQSTEHFIDAIFYSFGIMSFQVTKTGFQHGVATSMLVSLQMLFTLVFVPLFLLALRRKFRR